MPKKHWKQKNEYGKKMFGVRGKSSKTGKQFTYFYNAEQWKKARKSPEFQQWAKGQRPPPAVKKRIRIEARPVMHLAQEEINPKTPRLWDVAEQQTMKPSGGNRKDFIAQYRRKRGKG